MKLRHAAPIALVLSATLSAVRVLVLFAESWAAVRAERQGDNELLRICGEQALANSDKFRNACLAARADSAAPLLFKTLMRAVATAFTDFTECFNTPTRIVLLVLFLLSGVSAPLVKLVLTTFLRGVHAHDMEGDAEDTRVIIMGADSSRKRSAWGRVKSRLVGNRRARVDEASGSDTDDEFHESGVEPQNWGAGGWAPISLLPRRRSSSSFKLKNL